MPSRLLTAAAAAATTALATLPAFALTGVGDAVAAGPASAARGGKVVVTNACLDSVPDPGTTEPVKICYTLFKPAGASRDHKVPMVLHSHGWGGSRTTDAASFDHLLDAGYGVLSFDQRGFGESGGQAYVENPDVEGHDVRRLIARVARLPWVRKDAPGDPRMGAVGGSYGGGYQFLAAFEELRVKGKPVLDALAPEITWFDLNESLAPEGVVRTEWVLALSAAALPSTALPPMIYKALLEGVVTGTWPDGSIPGTEDVDAFFRKNGPRWHVSQGRRLDIPVLLGQGTTDGLFPLQQGLANWARALTPRSRRQSIFVGYNGGHVLPAVLPSGISVTSDPCSKQLGGGDFAALALKFLDEHLKGRDRGLRGYGKVHLATPDSTCLTVDTVEADTSFEVGTVATPETAGLPLSYPVAEGPITIAGTPYLTGKLTALGVNNRAFYGLAVGSSPLDAHLVQNNVLPLDEPEPVVGEKRRVDLPSVAVEVPAGQTLYVMVTPISDAFITMGSRTPGAVVLENAVVHLPVVE